MAIKEAIHHRLFWLPCIVLLCLCLPACEEYFLPELDGFEAVLVVDGAITDMPGPYTIKLSYSSGILPADQRAVEGATVVIMEEGGIQEILTEEQPGQYVTSENGIQGTTGKSYKINITLQDGTQYDSDYQEMPAPIAIDSVGANFEYHYLSIEEPEVPGYQFHITTQLAENSKNYLVWSMEATYKYHSDFTIDYTFDQRGITPYPNPSEFKTCWRTDQVNEVFSFNTAALSQPKIEELPLHFVRADQREFSIRYSLLVKQFTVNEAAFTFWNNLQRQIESQESLYNTQPFQIRGNLYNPDKPDETVLGYFMVAGQNDKRIFVDRPTALDEPFSYCEPDYMSYGMIGFMHRSNWPINVYEDEWGDRALGNEECFDCRKLGGTISRPEFWTE